MNVIRHPGNDLKIKMSRRVVILINIDRVILSTFKYEENTIFHVENHILNTLNVKISRADVKSRLINLLKENYIIIYESPEQDFEKAQDDLIEDYWFALSDKGKKYINDLI